MNAGGALYDGAGNLTNWNGVATYNYDAFNQMTHMTNGTQDWVYLYTADDERIWSYNIPANSSRWTLRDLGGKVLREYLSTGRWSVGTDYVYRDGQLLAAETQTGQRHFHLDHLGTPRLITETLRLPRVLPRLLSLRRRSDRLQPGHRAHEVHRPRAGSGEPGRAGG